MGILSIGKHGSLFIRYFKTPAQYKNVVSIVPKKTICAKRQLPRKNS